MVVMAATLTAVLVLPAISVVTAAAVTAVLVLPAISVVTAAAVTAVDSETLRLFHGTNSGT